MKRREVLTARAPARQRPRLYVIPAFMGIALATAACGGGGPNAGVASIATTTTTSTATATSRGPAPAAPNGGQPAGGDGPNFVRYATCMRSHGVANFPDDPGSAAGANILRALKESGAMSAPSFQAAAEACAKFAPTVGLRPQITTRDQADYLSAAACMRNHGITGFPDPVFTGGQVQFPIPNGMNINSTQFRRAREICEMLIPAGLPYSKEAEGGQ